MLEASTTVATFKMRVKLLLVKPSSGRRILYEI